MPITEKQRLARRKAVGSSDVAKILGESNYGTSWDVWAEKTGRAKDDRPSDAAVAGIRFEDGVLDFATQHLGEILKNQRRSQPEVHLSCNIDAILIEANEPMDAKTAGLIGPLSDKWGLEGTDQIPDEYIIQGHAHMLSMSDKTYKVGPGVCHIPAFLGGRGFQMFLIRRNQDLIMLIAEACKRFWERHVIPDIPPADDPGTLSILKRVYREAGSEAPVEPHMVHKWQKLKELRKSLKDAEDEALSMILTEMCDAERGVSTAGVVTYKEHEKTTVDFDAMKKDGIFERYVKRTPYRRAYFRQAKLLEDKS